MSWPTGTIATTALDADTDSPLLARPAIKDTADKVNEIVANGAPVLLTGNQTVAGTKTFSSPISGSVTGNAGTATSAGNADTVDGFHASQTPGANQIPALDGLGELVLTNGAGSAARLMPNGDLMAARSATNGVVFLSSDKVKYLQCLSGIFQFGSASNAFQARHDANTFHGRVAANGTAIRLPTGWTCVKSSTGIYDITHNLGHTNYSVVATLNSLGCVASTGRSANSLQIQSVNNSGVSTDSISTFMVMID